MHPLFLKKVGEYSIKPCTLDNLKDVININLTTLPEHYSDLFFENLLNGSPETFLVAEKNELLVGYIMCRIEYGFSNLKRFAVGRKGHIVSLAILEDHRRKKLGNALVEEALKGMAKQSCRESFLEVRVSNQAAVLMYQNLGFQITSRLEFYYKEGEAAFLMCRDLTNNNDLNKQI